MVFQAHPSLENPLHLLAHSSCATSGDGYLCFVASDFLDAYYSGSATEGDEEWFYGRHLTDGARGWFLKEHTMPLIAEGAAEVLANEAGQSALEETAAHEARAEARRQREAASQAAQQTADAESHFTLALLLLSAKCERAVEAANCFAKEEESLLVALAAVRDKRQWADQAAAAAKHAKDAASNNVAKCRRGNVAAKAAAALCAAAEQEADLAVASAGARRKAVEARMKAVELAAGTQRTAPIQAQQCDLIEMLQPSEGLECVPEADSGEVKKTLRILTFGLETCDQELVNECRHGPFDGARAQFTDDQLREAMHRQGEDVVALFSDARNFPDPDCHKYGFYHYGKNPHIICRICKNRKFPQWIRGLKWHVYAATNNLQQPLVTIALYCKKGKHRSVACAYIVQRIFREMGWSCPEPKHLSRQNWKSSCGEDACTTCHPATPNLDVELELERALKMWQALPVGGNAKW